MLVSLPVLADWVSNRYQVTAEDLMLPLLLGLLTSLIISAILYKSFRRNRFATLVGGVIATLIIGQNYDDRLDSFKPLMQSISPFSGLGAKDGIFYSVVFFCLILGLIFLIVRSIDQFTSKRNWETDVFANAIFITIAVTFFFQLYPTARIIVIEWPQFSYRPPAITTQMTRPDNKPDIYYIVLDRYTNQDILQNQMGYDNSDFTNFLLDSGFSVNPKANANYPYTTMSIASTLNANYNTDLVQKFSASPLQILEPYHDAIRYAAVTQKLKSLGYSYYQLGSWYETDNKAPLADYNYQPEGQLTVFSHTFTLNNFAKMELTDSFYWQFIKHGLSLGKLGIISYSAIGDSDATTKKLSNLLNIAEKPAGGKFIFAHVLVPHDPYYFNADGSISATPDGNNLGKPVKQKYLGQVQYINNQMKTLISKIKKNTDNKAVILIQSDEGPYPIQLNDENFDSVAAGDELDSTDMTSWSDQNLKMKYGVLAAYDIPAAKLSEVNANANSVNVFRVVFNTYFNAKMPYLPDCNYAFPDGRSQPYNYASITKRLTGATNTACPNDSNFK